MTTLLPDFSITCSQRRWACVLDPTLALSEYGLPLVKQLGEVIDLWVVRELWHILDNTYFFLQQQESIFVKETAPRQAFASQHSLSQQALRALKEWEHLRMETDLCSLNLFWIGDGVGESLLPKNVESNFIWRWESLAQNLDRQLNSDRHAAEPLTSAFRDAAALAAALGSAFILTHRSPEEAAQNLPPAICTTVERWGVNCQEIDSGDAIASLEREQLRQLLIHAGVSKLLWTGLRPAVLHLVVPSALMASPPPSWSEEFSLTELEDWQEVQEKDLNFWEGARGFWYLV
jgi:hypothetical protein